MTPSREQTIAQYAESMRKELRNMTREEADQHIQAKYAQLHPWVVDNREDILNVIYPITGWDLASGPDTSVTYKTYQGEHMSREEMKQSTIHEPSYLASNNLNRKQRRIAAAIMRKHGQPK